MSISHISTWIVYSFHAQGFNAQLFNYSPLLVMLDHLVSPCIIILPSVFQLFDNVTPFFSPYYFFNLGHIFHVCLTWFNLPFCFKRGEHVLQRGVLTVPGPAQGSQLAKAQLSMTSACIVCESPWRNSGGHLEMCPCPQERAQENTPSWFIRRLETCGSCCLSLMDTIGTVAHPWNDAQINCVLRHEFHRLSAWKCVRVCLLQSRSGQGYDKLASLRVCESFLQRSRSKAVTAELCGNLPEMDTKVFL
jgi:hypothetical protein